jgi:SAM-dependent methyltransferase
MVGETDLKARRSELEVEAVVRRYARRNCDDRYSILRPEIYQADLERRRAILRLLGTKVRQPLSDLRVLEVGCGSGDNLLDLVGWGCDPANLVGNELIPERALAARRRLPVEVPVYEGDAARLPIREGSFDVVYQSTVFTSLLDEQFRIILAKRMWDWLRPGGAVLWYDFMYNNPRNRDVSGIPLRRVRSLFPEAEISSRSITLAPPISRQVTRVHPSLYTMVNITPLLRTHVLCWIGKSSGPE